MAKKKKKIKKSYSGQTGSLSSRNLNPYPIKVTLLLLEHPYEIILRKMSNTPIRHLLDRDLVRSRPDIDLTKVILTSPDCLPDHIPPLREDYVDNWIETTQNWTIDDTLDRFRCKNLRFGVIIAPHNWTGDTTLIKQHQQWI